MVNNLRWGGAYAEGIGLVEKTSRDCKVLRLVVMQLGTNTDTSTMDSLKDPAEPLPCTILRCTCALEPSSLLDMSFSLNS